MTSNGFVTEVHHINEKAEDAGVVYAEVRCPRNVGHALFVLISVMYIHSQRCKAGSKLQET